MNAFVSAETVADAVACLREAGAATRATVEREQFTQFGYEMPHRSELRNKSSCEDVAISPDMSAGEWVGKRERVIIRHMAAGTI